LYIPDEVPVEKALSRVTHLGIGAHQDDLEIMACHGILRCYDDQAKWFGGIICTDGIGSIHTGKYARYSNAEIKRIRREEQEEAARLGRYGFVAQLDYESRAVKDPLDHSLVDDIEAMLLAAGPDVVADRHETHVAVCMKTIEAIRRIPAEKRPTTVYGCEVWRDLDWMLGEDKIALDVSGHDALSTRLLHVFNSQITGGKNYVRATLGRRVANATFFRSHDADEEPDLWFAMDLTALAEDETIDVVAFVLEHVERFRDDVEKKLKRFS